MKGIEKIHRIKIGLIVMYIVSLFLPVYSAVVNGTLYKTSISKVGAGTFFVIFFVVLLIATVVLYFVNKKYHNISYLVTCVFMTLLLFILAVFKQDGSTLRVAFYLQVVIVGLFFLGFFKETLTVTIFDTISRKTIEYSKAAYGFIKKKITEYKDNRKKKHSGNKEEDTTMPKHAKEEEVIVK